jgi:two-component system NarL family sensor kinase
MDTQIRERSQIANFLHDKFGSKLSHIIHLYELKKYELGYQNILEITKELRDFSHQILPKALDEGDLISSLQTYINKLNNENEQLKIELNAYDLPVCLEKQIAYNIYLITLELISNAINHAKPSEVTLEFYKYLDSYVFQFTDNGKGFDTNTTPKGFGIRTIESRVLGMGGNLEMNSKLEEGTIIQIVIPF